MLLAPCPMKKMKRLIINLLLTAVPSWIFFRAYMRFYTDATFWHQGNQLFIVFYAFSSFEPKN